MSDAFQKFQEKLEDIEVPEQELQHVIENATKQAEIEMRARKQKKRKIVAITTAAVALASSLFLLLPANEMKQESAQYSKAAPSIAYKDAQDALSNKKEEADQQAQTPAATSGEKVAVATNRKLIQNVELRMEATSFLAATNKLEESVVAFGGYIEGSTITGDSAQAEQVMRSASYTIRIPANKLEDYMKTAAGIGNITSKQMQTEDVTEQYVDTEARVKSLRLQEERLLELLKQSGSLKDIMEVEKELANVRYEIEGLTTTLKRFDALVEYSIVRIEVMEVQSLTQNATALGDRISQAFQKSITGIVARAQTALVFVLGNSPVLLLIGVSGGAVVWMLRRARQKKI